MRILLVAFVVVVAGVGTACPQQALTCGADVDCPSGDRCFFGADGTSGCVAAGGEGEGEGGPGEGEGEGGPGEGEGEGEGEGGGDVHFVDATIIVPAGGSADAAFVAPVGASCAAFTDSGPVTAVLNGSNVTINASNGATGVATVRVQCDTLSATIAVTILSIDGLTTTPSTPVDGATLAVDVNGLFGLAVAWQTLPGASCTVTATQIDATDANPPPQATDVPVEQPAGTFNVFVATLSSTTISVSCEAGGSGPTTASIDVVVNASLQKFAPDLLANGSAGCSDARGCVTIDYFVPGAKSCVVNAAAAPICTSGAQPPTGGCLDTQPSDGDVTYDVTCDGVKLAQTKVHWGDRAVADLPLTGVSIVTGVVNLVSAFSSFQTLLADDVEAAGTVLITNTGNNQFFVRMAKLRHVTGDFTITSAEGLNHTNDIDGNTSTVENSFGALATVGGKFEVSNSPDLRDTTFPSLSTVGGDFVLDNDDSLTSPAFPALAAVGGGFFVKNNGLLDSISAGASLAIEGAGVSGFALDFDQNSANLTCPEMQAFYSSLSTTTRPDATHTRLGSGCSVP